MNLGQLVVREKAVKPYVPQNAKQYKAFRAAFTREDGSVEYLPDLNQPAVTHAEAVKLGNRLFYSRMPGEHHHRVVDDTGLNDILLCPI